MDAKMEARLATDILENPMWSRTFARIEEELWESFQEVPPDHAEGLRGISLKFWALREVRSELERLLNATD